MRADISRRDALRMGSAMGLLTLVPGGSALAHLAGPVTPPDAGSIPVAFLISDGAVVIDFCGPWAVFEGVTIPGSMMNPFHLYTVGETTKPIRASSGMKITPDYALDDAPAPKVIVIPQQNGQSPAILDWIRRSTEHTDVTMSVCTGAFLLAKTGLLSGKAATTMHTSFADFEAQFPDIQLKRGARFVDNGRLASSGGLSSGIDLSLHVVERYFGREVAAKTAYTLEYQGQGWMDPNSNATYAAAVRASAALDKAHPACVVCGMDADLTVGQLAYKGTSYSFCMPPHKALFDANPQKFVAALAK